MTEREWLTCTDPKLMLEYLRGRVSERKLRLFACACARRVEHLLDDERSREAVEVAEKYAEGQAEEEVLRAAFMAARLAARDCYDDAFWGTFDEPDDRREAAGIYYAGAYAHAAAAQTAWLAESSVGRGGLAWSAPD